MTDDLLFSGPTHEINIFVEIIEKVFTICKIIADYIINFNGFITSQDQAVNITLSMERYVHSIPFSK